MRDYLSWTMPGLMLAAPLQILFGPALPWPAWLLIAPALGFVLQQTVRWRFERTEDGFRNPHRAALAVIIERGGLSNRTDRGDVAYQVYEIVFYQRPDWEAIRGHAHRCWDWIFLFQSTALGAALGTVLSLAGLATPGRAAAVLLLLALPAAAFVLRDKARQTLEALQLFDRATVLAHWPLYAQTLGNMAPK